MYKPEVEYWVISFNNDDLDTTHNYSHYDSTYYDYIRYVYTDKLKNMELKHPLVRMSSGAYGVTYLLSMVCE